MATAPPTLELDVPSLDSVVRRIDEISTLPQIALRVLEVANDPNAEVGDLRRIVEADPALSARVMRYVNSSAYARHTRTSTLHEAIAYLGLKQTRNLALAASVSKLFLGNNTIGPYSRSQLWQHLVSVGICARMIAMRRRMATFEEVFLAGLLHDIGIVMEDQYVHEQFVKVIESLNGDETLAETERKHLGFDHTVLGGRVAAVWRLPEATKASILYHHGSAAYQGEHTDTVRCVEVADLICALKGIPAVDIKLVTVSQSPLEGLSLMGDDIRVLAADLDHELNASSTLFEI